MKIKFTLYNLKVGGRFLIGLAGEATLQIPLTDYEGVEYEFIFKRIDKFATFNRVEYDKAEVINLLNSIHESKPEPSTTTGAVKPTGPTSAPNSDATAAAEHPATITGTSANDSKTARRKARRTRKARI